MKQSTEDRVEGLETVLKKKEVRWRTAALSNMFNRVMNTPMVKIKIVNCFKLLKRYIKLSFMCVCKYLNQKLRRIGE